MDDNFTSFWKANFYDYGNNPGDAIATLALDWGHYCNSKATLFADDDFVLWWEKLEYLYADRPSPATINVCQSWAAHCLNQRRSREWSSFEEWLVSAGKPFPSFRPIECVLVWSRQDAWVRHPDTDRWWHLRVESPFAEWTESFKTCSRYDLSC